MHNDNLWTPARFHSFITSALRMASKRWGPANRCKQAARVKRGVYRCVGYKRRAHQVPASIPPKPGNKLRINNAVVDHIEPVVDPSVGFVSWDEFIRRLFVEIEGYQLLCHECHQAKTNYEKEIANERKRQTRQD